MKPVVADIKGAKLDAYARAAHSRKLPQSVWIVFFQEETESDVGRIQSQIETALRYETR